jgi:hypothetical protein
VFVVPANPHQQREEDLHSPGIRSISLCFFIASWYLEVAGKARGKHGAKKGAFPTPAG